MPTSKKKAAAPWMVGDDHDYEDVTMMPMGNAMPLPPKPTISTKAMGKKKAAPKKKKKAAKKKAK